MSDFSSDHSDSDQDSSLAEVDGSDKEEASNAEVEKSSKEVCRELKIRVLKVQMEKEELKSYFVKSDPKNKVFFKGIQDEILLHKKKPNNILSCSNKVLCLSPEVLQEIIKHCHISDQIVLSLTSKQMALQVDKVQDVSMKKGIILKGPNTDLQRLSILLRMDDWMGARRLCFNCLKYLPVKQSHWFTRKNWEGTKWKGGRIRKKKEKSLGPKCMHCAVKDKLQMPDVHRAVGKLRTCVLKACS